jgi:hypothetical protein
MVEIYCDFRSKLSEQAIGASYDEKGTLLYLRSMIIKKRERETKLPTVPSTSIMFDVTGEKR